MDLYFSIERENKTLRPVKLRKQDSPATRCCYALRQGLPKIRTDPRPESPSPRDAPTQFLPQLAWWDCPSPPDECQVKLQPVIAELKSYPCYLPLLPCLDWQKASQPNAHLLALPASFRCITELRRGRKAAFQLLSGVFFSSLFSLILFYCP